MVKYRNFQDAKASSMSYYKPVRLLHTSKSGPKVRQRRICRKSCLTATKRSLCDRSSWEERDGCLIISPQTGYVKVGRNLRSMVAIRGSTLVPAVLLFLKSCATTLGAVRIFFLIIILITRKFRISSCCPSKIRSQITTFALDIYGKVGLLMSARKNLKRRYMVNSKYFQCNLTQTPACDFESTVQQAFDGPGIFYWIVSNPPKSGRQVRPAKLNSRTASKKSSVDFRRPNLARPSIGSKTYTECDSGQEVMLNAEPS